MISDWNEMKKRSKITHFLDSRWALGSLWWEGLFHAYNGRDGRLGPIVWSMRMRSAIPFKKDFFLLFRCDCGVPLLILERVMVQCSPVSPSDPVSFTAPQTDSCKSIKSSERSLGFGCDNDLQKTTNGEEIDPRCTHEHAPMCHIFHTPELYGNLAISPLRSDLTHIKTHMHTPPVPAADRGGSTRRNAFRGGEVCWMALPILLKVWVASLSSQSQWVAARNGPARLVIE